MAKRIDAWMKIELEPVPEGDDLTWDQWREWCEARGFDALNKRGAWISEIRTYLRGAKWLIYADGGLVGLADEHDVACGWIRLDGDADAAG